MKKHHFSQSLEDNLRALLILTEEELGIRRVYLEDLELTGHLSYQKVIKALSLINDIKRELGYKVPEDTSLPQIPLFKE
jgi:hypothetical protein